MKPGDLPALAQAAAARADMSPPMNGGRVAHILIVDDDPGIVQTLGRMLDGVGSLRFACSGAEALHLAREQPPDLVLLDAEMPGMNGFEVCHALKADAALAGAAVIFVTSHGEPAFEVEALGVGAADFITKPPMAEQVLARVHARLRCHAAGAALPRHPAGGAPPAATRLLLVACDDDWLHFNRVALAPMFGTVQFARGGAEALALMTREPFDLVVAVLQLPDMDGFVLCRRVCTDAALRQPAVLLVGQRADWRSEAHAFEMGASDFVAPPFPPAVLQARVRNLLRQRREAATVTLARRSAWRLLDDARVADLVAAAPDAWLAVDTQDRIVLANTAAAWQLGVDPGRLLGRPLAELRAHGSWPGTAATWPLGEGEDRVTALRLNAREGPA